MPPRRSHKKSKAGCQRCKTRKIKCDEVHPACGNCMKHGVACDFEASISPLSADTPPLPFRQTNGETNGNHGTPASTPIHGSPDPSQASPSASAMMPFYQKPTDMMRADGNSNPISRSFELKLMHHFTAYTSHSFAETDQQRLAWQINIPVIAYDAPYLMDAMLAAAALHMRTQSPNDKSLVRASHGYMASALSQYSKLLKGGVSGANAEALFATSALIAFQASASRRFEEDQAEGRYTLPLAWFHSFQGVKTIVMASWKWLRSSDRVFHIINGQPALFLDLDPEKKLFFAPLLHGMEEDIARLPERLQADTKQAYVHSVAFLNWAHKRPVRKRILGFAATVSRRFVELLDQYDPRAMVIIAYFFALTRVVDDVWWLQGVAAREVNGIMSILPQEWWPKMEWAMRIANHEGVMDEHTWGVGLDSAEKVKVEEDEPFNVHMHIDLLAKMLTEKDENISTTALLRRELSTSEMQNLRNALPDL